MLNPILKEKYTDNTIKFLEKIHFMFPDKEIFVMGIIEVNDSMRVPEGICINDITREDQRSTHRLYLDYISYLAGEENETAGMCTILSDINNITWYEKSEEIPLWVM